jgi:hypothetical protein
VNPGVEQNKSPDARIKILFVVFIGTKLEILWRILLHALPPEEMIIVLNL